MMTDYNDYHFKLSDDFIAEERLSYSRFYLNYVTRRPNQAPNKFDKMSELRLPINSILHSLHGFETLEAGYHGLPDPTLSLVNNETLPVYLRINTDVAGSDAKPFGVSETYIYRPNVLKAQINHFYQAHRKFHRMLSERTIGTMAGVLSWMDYSPLNELRVTGVLHQYRKFDIIFRTILDKIVSIGGGKHHYILFPQNNHVITRTALQRSFRELSTGSLAVFNKDVSLYPLIHILGYVYGFLKDMNPTPYKEDIKILGKDHDLFKDVKTTSLLERLPTDLKSEINFIFYHQDRAFVYNLADLTQFAEDPSFYTKLYRHFMNLRLGAASGLSDSDIDSDNFDKIVSTLSNEVEEDESHPSEDKISLAPKEVIKETPQFNRQDTFEIKLPQEKPVNFEEKLRKEVVLHHQSLVIQEPKKEAKRNSLLETHLKATLKGKALSELIKPLDINEIKPKDMSFLNTPETSYQQSSLIAMDKTYQNHVYDHEMGKVVSSLAKHGFFITKVEEQQVHTEMDRLSTYKLHLNDVAGKTHYVKFTIPDVDDNGMMKISGVEYRLTRQIANVPICKISPTRVNLSSYYNKIIVKRVESKRFSYAQDLFKLITLLKAENKLDATLGQSPLPTKAVAYDYTALGENFTELKIGNYHFILNGSLASYPDSLMTRKGHLVEAWEKQFGVFVGFGERNTLLYWAKDNHLRLVEDGIVLEEWASFTVFLNDVLGDQARLKKTPVEWCEANIINQTIPLVYILAYKLGLKELFEYIKLDYRFYETKKEYVLGIDDLEVPFSDGILVFNRYPLSRSLIAAGLLWADLSDVSFRDMSVPDIYPKIFNKKKMSVGVLKGLNGFFDFFIDPITESILEKMKEPTNFKDLLLRANIMLTDAYAEEATALKIHRFRLYERFNGILYNEIYTNLSNYRNNPSTKKSFSINPEAVFQKIVQDATVAPNEVINPVHEVKQRSVFTFTGKGGRTDRSFVLKDRVYPKDGVGVISDAVPDSGKVSITAYLSASPRIDDVHGIAKPYASGDVLEPPQILSIGSMVMPAGTTDDGKRNAYLSIQISHYVPNIEEGETLSVRTGYDAVLPHLTSSTFAIAASDSGIIDEINEQHQVIKVKYQDKPIKALKSLSLPYLDSVLDNYRDKHLKLSILVKDTEISDYPQGGIFKLTKNSFGKVVDRIRYENSELIEDKDVKRKYSHLIKDLSSGKVKALYLLELELIKSIVPGEIKSYSYANIYSQNSGSYLLQTRVPNVRVGEKIKQGDILIYNKGFFVPDGLSKQVTFKHGVLANIALIEKASNHEDACEISSDLSQKLKMTPCHLRTIVTKKDAVIVDSVKLGDHVEVASNLCIISDDYLIGSSLELSADNLDLMEKLNRQTPPADYTGHIVKIRLLYGCDRSELSPSLLNILKTYEKELKDQFKAMNTDMSVKPPEKPGWVAPGTRYAGIEFTKDTVVLEYMIQETLSMAEGDKLVISNAAKSIVSHVSEKQHYSESGLPIDMLFSTTSIVNRIISSPLSVGITERVMQKLKEKVVSIYFDN